MQDPQQPRLEVRAPAVGVDQLRLPAQRDRHRVDREVAPGEVVEEAGGLDLRQCPGVRVGLGAGAGDVDLVAVEIHLGGGEPLVRDHLGAEPSREVGGVALDDEVEVGAPAAQQQVADRAADQVDGLLAGGLAHGGQLRVGALQRRLQVVDRLRGH